jgi:hypothetical protein
MQWRLALGEVRTHRARLAPVVVDRLAQRPPETLTDLLLDLISRVAKNLAVDEQWYANQDAFDIFRAAINELLSELFLFAGGGTGAGSGATSKLRSRYGANEKSDIIGRILARAVFVETANERLKQIFDSPKKQ